MPYFVGPNVPTMKGTTIQLFQEDTILGLARFLEPENWEFTCSLAARYSLQDWLVAATHLEVSQLNSSDFI